MEGGMGGGVQKKFSFPGVSVHKLGRGAGRRRGGCPAAFYSAVAKMKEEKGAGALEEGSYASSSGRCRLFCPISRPLPSSRSLQRSFLFFVLSSSSNCGIAKKSSLPRSFPLLSVEFALLCFLLFSHTLFFCSPSTLSGVRTLSLLYFLTRSHFSFDYYKVGGFLSRFFLPWLVLGRPLHQLPAPASEGNTAPPTTTRFLLSLSDGGGFFVVFVFVGGGGGGKGEDGPDPVLFSQGNGRELGWGWGWGGRKTRLFSFPPFLSPSRLQELKKRSFFLSSASPVMQEHERS